MGTGGERHSSRRGKRGPGVGRLGGVLWVIIRTLVFLLHHMQRHFENRRDMIIELKGISVVFQA